MLILLPNERNGLPDLLQTLTANEAEFARILERDNFVFAWVSLSLLKFSIDGDIIPLADKFASMGLSSPFGRDADLSGITGRRDIYVASFQHKALIDVSALICYTCFVSPKKIMQIVQFVYWLYFDFTRLVKIPLHLPQYLFSFSRWTRMVPRLLL